jgi:transposase
VTNGEAVTHAGGLIDEALWRRLSLLPNPFRRKAMGPPPSAFGRRLTGILFVLRSSIPWHMLPKEMGCGSGSICCRRLIRWQRAGVCRRLRAVLLAELRRRSQLDSAHAVVDLTEADGIPLTAVLASANRYDTTQPRPLVDAIPPLRRCPVATGANAA